MRIINHGYKKYICLCSSCGCHFEYDISEVDHQNNVKCPDCGNDNIHAQCRHLQDKFEDNLDSCNRPEFKGNCYLAGGWFTSAQKLALDKIETLLTFAYSEDIKLYSPRISNNFNKIKGPRTTEDRMKCFKDDIEAIDKCDFMICSAVEYDSGTMVELGYAYAKGKPIIYYNDNPEDHKRIRNLMLVGMCNNYYAKNIDDLDSILKTGNPTDYGDDSEKELGRLGE